MLRCKRSEKEDPPLHEYLFVAIALPNQSPHKKAEMRR
jgi:hypothetical protein